MAHPWRDLERDLAASVEGEVRFDGGSRALYATDASNHRQLPVGVVTPRTRADVVAAIAACRAHDVPVLPRGAGTSLAGQACNAAVVLDLSRHLDAIVDVDPDARTARVEPGVVLDDLQRAAAPHRLRFGPDPATHAVCTLGGMIGNDACGVHSVRSGRTSDQVVSLEVATYDGAVFEVGAGGDPAAADGRRAEILRGLSALADREADRIRAERRDLPRLVSGYDLDALLPERGFDVARSLVGSEGTLATVLAATVRLVDRAPATALLLLGYPDVFAAADHVPEVLAHAPIGLEGLDVGRMRALAAEGVRIDGLDLLPDADGWLLVEFGGETAEAAEAAARAAEAAARRAGAPTARVCEPAAADRAWRVRESGLRAIERAGSTPPLWPGWEDSAVRPDRLADYLRDLRDLLDAHGLRTALYGHFGDGCVHARISFDLGSADGVARYAAFLEAAADLCCGRYGGSLSGEHGDGLTRGPLLPRMYSPEAIAAMREVKAIWDPAGRMNPGRVVEAADPTDHLRLGPGYDPPATETDFAWPDDGGAFATAALRCVGAGACRRTEGGTMCPSYRVTREERHSTRGRARLLFEMLNGETVDGWGDAAVRESLELCLGCKACKRECPVAVDMATCKAEFLARHWEGRIRPRSHYALGGVRRAARLAARAPRWANRLLAAPGVAGLAKRTAGIAPDRALPRFAEETFTAWFRARGPSRVDGPEVVVFPDTFHDHFDPGVLRAAVETLEWAGLRPTIPDRPLCCGRPLFHYGRLGRARTAVREVVDALAPSLRAGVPVVGLEPSCVSVFRDEARSLFGDDPDVARLAAGARLFGEVLADLDVDWPRPGGRALLHVHCHQAAVLDAECDRALLERVGYAVDAPDAGCCGMAGAFGFERATKDVAVAVGERVLLPAVRDADPGVEVVSGGWSCREQIARETGRRARHVAEVVRDAVGAGR